MLRIKRASAGSGKTYELAKFYIKLLISSKQSGFKRQLLQKDSFKENLSSIMAVTFTVKATGEMKQRIVEKLADLARADDPNLTAADLKSINYLDEFISDFNSDKYEIAELARKALRTLLLNYSDFKVQTIDSFFQSILHTFVYEASLDDNFNMEINTDLITAVGLGTALDDLSESENPELLYWLRKMMDQKAHRNKWNVFTRDESNNSLYSGLIKEAKHLEKEDYQKLKEDMYAYFDGLDRPFREIVEEVDDANLAPLKKFHDIRRDKATRLADLLEKHGLSPNQLNNGRTNAKNLLISLREFDFDNFEAPEKEIKERAKGKAPFLSADAEKAFVASGILSEADVAELGAAFSEWAYANANYLAAFSAVANDVFTWLHYRSLLPKLMIVLEIARRKDAYLQATNSLQISDTSHILARIIGEDDAPFVYERMGSRLDHFLIDEFQDTSWMQWRNIKPLIDESESKGQDNLIIGDAKQSIYRFRNADYTLISGLENEFADVVYYTQETPPAKQSARTTNFRSSPTVVDFNNQVFTEIINLTDKSDEPLFTQAIKDVYQDCGQDLPPNKTGPSGYVDVVFYPKNSKTDEEGEEKPEGPGFTELPDRIIELHKRGYKFRDIGILVKSHNQGAMAMDVISRYNSEHPEAPISIISEEDLLVSSSLAVKIIVNALETAASGMKVRTKDNPVLTDPIDEDELFRLLRSLNTLALPSVVEAIIGKFVPYGRRSAEAPFIAAFQDAVLDYCTSRPGDIGSFLKWWKLKSRTLSITSPEDSDGVRLQTIHKAKGLEYKCVIIPEANFSFNPGNFTEWRWVPVAGGLAKSNLLPPFLPVETVKSLEKTAHDNMTVKYREEFALDELNKMYVAFTRAVFELYVYVPVTNQSDERKAGGTLKSILLEDPGEGRIEAQFGSPLTPKEIEGVYNKENNNVQPKETMDIESYEAAGVSLADELTPEGETVKTLLFHNDNPLKTIVHTDGSEEEIDPRAEGTIKHKVMQMVETPEDIDKALRRLKVEGIVSDEQVEQWGAQLREAIESVGDRGWFSSRNKVFNERPILKGRIHKVPDRFVVTPEGDAVIIDYKFGTEEEDYKKQIEEYASMLRQSGMFRNVSAFLWYVPQGKILPVGTVIE